LKYPLPYFFLTASPPNRANSFWSMVVIVIRWWGNGIFRLSLEKHVHCLSLIHPGIPPSANLT
jgi:hypothetical protein